MTFLFCYFQLGREGLKEAHLMRRNGQEEPEVVGTYINSHRMGMVRHLS